MGHPVGIEWFRRRHSGGGHAIVTRGDYHECSCGATYLCAGPSIIDASGRPIAPPQTEPAERPAGPHDSNADARTPVRE